MRIMLVGPYPPPFGGISVHIQRLKYYLEKRGHECFVCRYDAGVSDSNSNVILMTSIKKIWRKTGNLFWETKKVNPDVIHIHHCGGDFLQEMKPILFWKLMRKRVFITFHGGSFVRYVSESKKRDFIGLWLILRMVGKIICASESQKTIILEKFGRWTQSKLHTMSPFLPPIEHNNNETHEPANVRQFYHTKNEIITAIGGWRRYHKFESVIEAFDLFHKENKTSGLALFVSSGGDEQYKDEIFKLIKEKGLNNCILVLEDIGCIDNYLKKSSVFIRPSSIDSYSISIAEALWFGIPVIANDAIKRPHKVSTFSDGDARNLYQKIQEVKNYYKHSNLKIKEALRAQAISMLAIYN